MQIQFNTDHNIHGHESMALQAETILRGALEHYSNQITRVEIHLSDENSDKKIGPADVRCMLEARIANQQPVAVHDQAASVSQALEGAATKLRSSIESRLGRLSHR